MKRAAFGTSNRYNKKMNPAIQQWLIRFFLIGTAILAPLLVATQFVRAASAPASQLRGALVSQSLQLAQGTRGAAQSGPSKTSPITAVLYTTGSATVSWNGRDFAVNNGSYAYVGGESIQMAPNSIGLLQLSNGSSVYACAGSSLSITRADSGAYRLDIGRGSSRFSFKPGTDFKVRANDTQIAPTASVGGEEREGEVLARANGGALVCELSEGLKVSTAGADVAPSSAFSGLGRITEVVPTQAGVTTTTTPIPATAIAASANSSGASGPVFLCQCEDLKRQLDEFVAPQIADGQAGEVEPQADSTVSEAGPAEATADTSETVAPPVVPPDAPPVTLAEPGIPDPFDPFDPNVLPPPAAGEPTGPVVVVAPPAVPSSGSGGGGIASPS